MSKDMTITTLSPDKMGQLIRPLCEKGVTLQLESHGKSMLPFIRSRDCLTLSPLIGLCPRRGDVLAYIHPPSGTLKIHRAVRVKGGRVLLKGDNCFRPDADLLLEDILGRVTAVERRGRPVYLGLGREKGIIGLLSRFKVPWLVITMCGGGGLKGKILYGAFKKKAPENEK